MLGLGLNIASGTLALSKGGGVAIAGLDLDFVNGRYAWNSPYRASPADIPGWSFSRSGGGDAVSFNGQVQSFATGVPRIVPGRGLLIEAASGPRGADFARILGLSALLNEASPYTIVVDVEWPQATQANAQFLEGIAAGGDLAGASVGINSAGTRPRLTHRAGTNRTDLNPGIAVDQGPGQTTRMAFNSLGRGTANAGPIATSVATPTQANWGAGDLAIGARWNFGLGVGWINSYVRRVRVLPYAATDAELQALTSPVNDWSESTGLNPASLFAGGVAGAWFDPSDLSSMYEGRTGTTPVSIGGLVGQILDKSGNGNHAVAASNSSRATLRQAASGHLYLDFDGLDDCYLTPSIASAAQETYAAGITRRSGTNTVHVYGPGEGLPSDQVSPLRLAVNAFQPAYSSAGALTPSIPYVLGTPVVAVADRNDARADQQQIRLRANLGAPGFRGAVGDATVGAYVRTIGSFRPSDLNFAPIDFYGLIHVVGPVADTTRDAIARYLAGKSGVPL